MSEELKPFKVYSNEIQVSMSQFDITLILNENVIPNEKVLHGYLKISPQLAISLANILNENIGKYEEYFGKIPNPSPEQIQALVAQWNTEKK